MHIMCPMLMPADSDSVTEAALKVNWAAKRQQLPVVLRRLRLRVRCSMEYFVAKLVVASSTVAATVAATCSAFSLNALQPLAAAIANLAAGLLLL